jgi:hypothetical protein
MLPLHLKGQWEGILWEKIKKILSLEEWCPFLPGSRAAALLQAEARKFGEMFLALGASLSASPEYITFERQEVDIRYHSSRGNNRVYKSEEINGARLIMLTHDIRESLLRVAELSEQASNRSVTVASARCRMVVRNQSLSA